MKFGNVLFCFLLFSFIKFSFAQEINNSSEKEDTQDIDNQQLKLENALIEKDTATLNKILHRNMILGHSNAWTETKNTLLETLPTSDIFYSEFKHLESSKYILVRDDLYNVVRYFKAIGQYKTHPFDLNLKTIEVWIKENETWQLLSRQSVEVERIE